MDVILFKFDLDHFSDHDILMIAKMYNLSGNISDLRWLIAIKHSQKAQMLSGNVMFFVEKIPQLQAVAEKRNDASFPNIDNSYIQELLILIKDQKQSKRLPKDKKQAILDDLKGREEVLQSNENWGKIQELHEQFNIKQQLFDWVLKSYLSGGINKIKDISSRLKPSINNFNLLKKHKKIDQKLQQFNGLKGLEEFLDQYKEQLREIRGELTELEKGRQGGELIYNGKDIKIIQPATVAGACYYGRGTRWCTSTTKSDNRFDDYNIDGPLYIIQPKRPSRDQEKYQLQFETNTFADENDININLSDLIKKYPEIIALRKYNPNVLKSVYGEHSSLKQFLQEIKDNPINADEVNAFFKGLQPFNERILNYLADNFEIQNDIEYPSMKLLYFLEHKNILNKVVKLRLNKNFKYDIQKFTNLIELYAPGYNLSQESLEHIGKLNNLQKLYLDNNLISELPSAIGELSNLQTLSIGYNKLQKLPDSIKSLSDLQMLNLGNNYLRELPDSIDNLKNLRVLNIQNNRISLLPDSIDNLKNLKELNIQNNRIRVLPETIGKLYKLIY